MAVTLKGSNPIYQGLSTDDKPTENVAVNTTFEELDTNDIYYFTGETWEKVGGSNGTEDE